MLVKQTDKITLPEGTKVPNHIAMILDGNRRWARARGMEPWEGHKAGYAAINKVARASRELGVHTFTMWAFSTENWDRPTKEIEEIMNILRYALKEVEKEFHDQKIRLVHLGRKDRLPKDVIDYIAKIEKETYEYGQNNVVNLALDYGGRDELLRAVHKVAQLNSFAVEKMDVKGFEKFLDTGDQPYPNVDLFIRTSGEQRTSGLMPWQMDYAEYYFEEEHLPDFTVEKLRDAVLDYSRRRRRFGGNDTVEHLKFDPKILAGLEIKWRRALGENSDHVRLRDLAIDYLKAQYGMSKDLALDAGVHMAHALLQREAGEWESAKRSLIKLYEVVKQTVGLAFEPELVANIEVNLWKSGGSEDGEQKLLAEKFRFSELQAKKSAHLAYLANEEVKKANWDNAKGYLEKFYFALKERVA